MPYIATTNDDLINPNPFRPTYLDYYGVTATRKGKKERKRSLRKLCKRANIRYADYFTPSEVQILNWAAYQICLKRWGDRIQHLRKKYPLQVFKGEYVTFWLDPIEPYARVTSRDRAGVYFRSKAPFHLIGFAADSEAVRRGNLHFLNLNLWQWPK